MQSNTLSIKNIDPNVLKLYKMYPKIDDFNYLRYQFYIYVYLNPFKEYKKPELINKEYITKYELLYVGKASNGGGYRHNQHINKFISNQEHNPLKVKAFKELEEGFRKAKQQGSFSLPHDWKEYQNNWIVLLKDFNTSKELMKFEMELINSVGTLYTKKGKQNTLVNKIEN
jgi:hypothetical protein